MKRRILILLAIAVSISFLGACSKKAEGTDEKKLSVYSSFYPVWDFTSKIGGDKIDNKLLVPMGTEAHDWEPSTTDIANLEKADVLVINGAGMESWSDSIIDSLSNENLSVIVAADGIDLMEGHCHHDHDHENCDHDSEEDKHEDHDACCEDHAKKDGHQDHDACCEDHAKKDGHEDHDACCEDHAKEKGHEDHDACCEDHAKEKGHEDHDACCEDHAKEEGHEHHHHHGGLDPHIWTSPSLAKREMENIMKGLCEKDPENADYYKSNYKKYSEEFDKLDKEFKTEIEKLPNRDIVVSHEAFGYLAKDYGLNQIGIEGLIPESEPTPQKMAEIIDFVKDNNVKVIFFETTSGSKVADSIGKATGAKPMVLNTLESLTKEEVESGDDYFSVMRKNLEAIKEALK